MVRQEARVQRSQLEVFDAMPFLFWAKDADGRYI